MKVVVLGTGYVVLVTGNCFAEVRKIIYLSLPKDDPKQKRPEINKAKLLLNWEPMISRKEGLKITYDYLQISLKSR
jgi:nucleoside-diphosphate-sugar epimerase